MAEFTIAANLFKHKIDLDEMLIALNALLAQGVPDNTERTRLELAIKDISRAKKTLNLIICDSRI